MMKQGVWWVDGMGHRIKLRPTFIIACFLSPGENLASEGGRLLLLILIILLF